MLPPPQAFLIVFFLSAKNDWETGREQKGASGSSVARGIRAQGAMGRRKREKEKPAKSRVEDR